jgi:ferrochelatase
MQRLKFSNPYRLCWQSQVGPRAWLGPQTSDSVEEYISKGQKDLVLIPVAFTSDHIETLYELDQEVIGESGHADSVKRVESLNGSTVFIRALADIAKAHLDANVACSAQMGLRCPGCKSDRCLESKRFFAGQQVRL